MKAFSAFKTSTYKKVKKPFREIVSLEIGKSPNKCGESTHLFGDFPIKINLASNLKLYGYTVAHNKDSLP